jgi:hypothetical protein
MAIYIFPLVIAFTHHGLIMHQHMNGATGLLSGSTNGTQLLQRDNNIPNPFIIPIHTLQTQFATLQVDDGTTQVLSFGQFTVVNVDKETIGVRVDDESQFFVPDGVFALTGVSSLIY